ncbi:hypothetical protein Efla_000996 [Eimeria flavescens]
MHFRPPRLCHFWRLTAFSFLRLFKLPIFTWRASLQVLQPSVLTSLRFTEAAEHAFGGTLAMWGPQTLEGRPADFGAPGGGPLSPFSQRSTPVAAPAASGSSPHQAATSPHDLEGLLSLNVDTSVLPPPTPAAPLSPSFSSPSKGAPEGGGGAPTSTRAASPGNEQEAPFSPVPASPGPCQAVSPVRLHASLHYEQQRPPAPSQGAPLWAPAEAWASPQPYSPNNPPFITTPPPSLAVEAVLPPSPLKADLAPQQQLELGQQELPGLLQQQSEAAANELGAPLSFSPQQNLQQPEADLWQRWQQSSSAALLQQQQLQHGQKQQQQEERQQNSLKEEQSEQPPAPPPSWASSQPQMQSAAAAAAAGEQQQQQQQQQQEQDHLWGAWQDSLPPVEQQQQQHQLQQQEQQHEQQKPDHLQLPQQQGQPALATAVAAPEQQPQQLHHDQQSQQQEPRPQLQAENGRQLQQQQKEEPEISSSASDFPSETACGPPRSLPASDASVGVPEAAAWGSPVQNQLGVFDSVGAPGNVGAFNKAGDPDSVRAFNNVGAPDSVGAPDNVGALNSVRAPDNFGASAFSWKPISLDSAAVDSTPGGGAPSERDASNKTPELGAPLGPSPRPTTLSPAAAPDSLWHPPHVAIPNTSAAEAAAAAAADAAAGSGSVDALLGVRVARDSRGSSGPRAGEGATLEGGRPEGEGDPSMSCRGPLSGRDNRQTGGGAEGWAPVAARAAGDLASAFSPPKRSREEQTDAAADAAEAATTAPAAEAVVVSAHLKQEEPAPSNTADARSPGAAEAAATTTAAGAAVSRKSATLELAEGPGDATPDSSRGLQPAGGPPRAAAAPSQGGGGGAASRLLRVLPFGLGVLRGGAHKQQQATADSEGASLPAAAAGAPSSGASSQPTTEFERLLKEPFSSGVNGASPSVRSSSRSPLGGASEAAAASPQGAPSRMHSAKPSGSPGQEGLPLAAPQDARSAWQSSSGQTAAGGAARADSRVQAGASPPGSVAGGVGLGGPQPLAAGGPPGDSQGRPRTPYNLFLERLKDPSCAEVVALLRRFVEGFPAAISRQEAADLLHAFITKAQARLLRTEAFAGGGTLQLSNGRGAAGWGPLPHAREASGGALGPHAGGEWDAAEVGEGLERFLIQKLFAILPKETAEDKQEDAQLDRKLRCLAWVEPQHLEIPPLTSSLIGEDGQGGAPLSGVAASKAVDGSSPGAPLPPAEGQDAEGEGGPLSVPEVQLAGLELGRIDRVRAPRDKTRLILSACKLLMAVLEKTRRAAPAADDLLPLLIYTVIKTRPPRLHSNIQFVAAYRHPARMQGEEAYFFTHFCSAAAFIKSVGSPGIHFHIEPAEYERRLAQAEQALREEEAREAAAAAAADPTDPAAAAAAVAAAAAAGGTGPALAAAATALSTLEQLHPSSHAGSLHGGPLGHSLGFRGASLLQHAGGAPWLQRQRQLQQQQSRLLLAQLVRIPRTFQGVRTAAHLKVGDLEGLLAEYQELLGAVDRAAVLLQQQLKLDQDCSKLQQQAASSESST